MVKVEVGEWPGPANAPMDTLWHCARCGWTWIDRASNLNMDGEWLCPGCKRPGLTEVPMDLVRGAVVRFNEEYPYRQPQYLFW